MKTSRNYPMPRLLRHIYSLAIVFLLFSSTAFAAKTATFLMMSGKEYQNVQYKVQTMYKVVEIKVDSTKINLSYADIAAIHDNSGVDITYATIGRDSRTPHQTAAKAIDTSATEVKPDSIAAAKVPVATDTTHPAEPTSSPDTAVTTPPAQAKSAPQNTFIQQEAWSSKNDETYREGQKSSWSLLFSILAGYTLPFGDYYEGINGGFGIEGEILVPVSREIGIGAMVGRASLQTDYKSLDVTSWKFLLLVHYLIESNNRKNLTYLSAGAGVTSLSLSEAGSKDETNFTLPLKAGIILPLGRTLGLNLGIGYDFSFVSGIDSDGNDALAGAYEFNVRAGLTFAVPRKSR